MKVFDHLDPDYYFNINPQIYKTKEPGLEKNNNYYFIID
jgi:hypothetical protein